MKNEKTEFLTTHYFIMQRRMEELQRQMDIVMKDMKKVIEEYNETFKEEE